MTNAPYPPSVGPEGNLPSPPALPYGILWIVCGWCPGKPILNALLCPAKNDGEVSDGMCRSCFDKAMNFVALIVPWSLLAAFGGIQP